MRVDVVTLTSINRGAGGGTGETVAGEVGFGGWLLVLAGRVVADGFFAGASYGPQQTQYYYGEKTERCPEHPNSLIQAMGPLPGG